MFQFLTPKLLTNIGIDNSKISSVTSTREVFFEELSGLEWTWSFRLGFPNTKWRPGMLEFARSSYFKAKGYESLDLVEDILSELDVYDRSMDLGTVEGKEYTCFQWFIKNRAKVSGLVEIMDDFIDDIDDDITALNWNLAVQEFIYRLQVSLRQRTSKC